MVTETKHLYKSATNRMLCGVCGGVGEFFNIDPTIVRLVVVLLGFTLPGLVAYIIAACIIPEQSDITYASPPLRAPATPTATQSAPTAPVVPATPVITSVTLAPDIAAGLANLDLKTGGCDVLVETGEAFSVSGSNILEAHDGDTWKISMRDKYAARSGQIYLTLPADTHLKTVRINHGAGKIAIDTLACDEAHFFIGMGSLKLDALSCETLRLEIGAGDANISGAVASAGRIKVGTGSVSLTTTRYDEFGYDVKCGLGSVTVDGNKYTGLAQGVNVHSDATPFFDIDCALGNVTLAFI